MKENRKEEENKGTKNNKVKRHAKRRTQGMKEKREETKRAEGWSGRHTDKDTSRTEKEKALAQFSMLTWPTGLSIRREGFGKRKRRLIFKLNTPTFISLGLFLIEFERVTISNELHFSARLHPDDVIQGVSYWRRNIISTLFETFKDLFRTFQRHWYA